tara:strand:- start:15030 stop:15578 length:549 start_codon:yes stop_codon:yes gene_type:complete
MSFFGNESILVLPKFNSGLTFSLLKKQLNWKQNQLKLFGRTHNEPRLTAWFGPKYSYSSITWESSPFPEFLKMALDKVSDAADFNFNAALINYYRDGSDSMGWHSDDEKEIDQSCIASLSFGEERRFLLRNKQGLKLKKEFLLKDNDLLLMNNLQKNWQHSIPKTTRPLSGRINITFRRITD